MGALARTDISASDGQDGMRKKGDSPDFEYRRQMAGTPQAWSHLAFIIRDDRVSGHVRFGPFSEHRFDVLPGRGGDIEGIWQSGLKMGAAAKTV